MRCRIVSGLVFLCFVARIALADSQPDFAAAGGQWVTTWACAPQWTQPANRPPAPRGPRTLRQFVRVSIGGKQLRARFGNTFGTEPVIIEAARVALSAGNGSAGSGEINSAADAALTFRGAPGVVIPP